MLQRHPVLLDTPAATPPGIGWPGLLTHSGVTIVAVCYSGASEAGTLNWSFFLDVHVATEGLERAAVGTHLIGLRRHSLL